MEQLLVSHWHKNTRYEIQSINATAYIVPCEYGSVYDQIKSENSMMTDALDLGKYLTENNLGQKEMMLDFIHKYGLLGIGTINSTNYCENKIVSARAVYDSLTDEQKALVTNYDVLTKAESDYDALPQTGMSGFHKLFAGLAALMQE